MLIIRHSRLKRKESPADAFVLGWLGSGFGAILTQLTAMQARICSSLLLISESRIEACCQSGLILCTYALEQCLVPTHG